MHVWASTGWLVYAQFRESSAWWGFAYLLLPGTLIALDRMLTDLPFTTLCVGSFYFASRKKDTAVFVTATLACLAREMGALIVIGYVAYAIWRREFRRAIFFICALIPLAAWSLAERHLTKGESLPYVCCSYPGSSVAAAFRTPSSYALPLAIARIVQAFDSLSLLAFVVCLVLFLVIAKRGADEISIASWATAGFVLLAVMASCIPGSFDQVYDYGRQYSPIFVVLLFAAIKDQRLALLTPITFMTLRVAIQLSGQVNNILHAL